MLKNLFFLIIGVVGFDLSNASEVPQEENQAILEEDYQKLSQALENTLNGVVAAITAIEGNVDRQKLEGIIANLNQKLDVETIFYGINSETPGFNDAKRQVQEFTSNVKVLLIQSIKDIAGIQGAKQKYGEKQELRSWIDALNDLENKTKAELNQGKNFLEVTFSYAWANFIAISPQATAEEKQVYKNIATAKEQETTNSLKALQKAASERNHAFKKANDERRRMFN